MMLSILRNSFLVPDKNLCDQNVVLLQSTVLRETLNITTDTDCIFSIVAVVEGGALQEIYDKVKSTISEQSGQHVWLPSDEAI